MPYGNFDSLASQELPRSHRIVLVLGPLGELLSRRQECSFCGLVVSAISQAWKQHSPTPVIQGTPVKCTMYNRVVGVVRDDESGIEYHENFERNKYQYSNCRIVIECKPSPPGCPSQVEIQAVDTGAAIKGLFDDAGLFTKRPQECMDKVNFALLKTWLSHCETSHAARCSPDAIPHANPDKYLKYFRCIDVTKKKVVDSADDRYVALSYVWGTAPFLRLLQSNRSELYKDGALDARNNDVPKTVQDAMRVAGQLGLRYLWVDALCIVQDDLNEKAEVIGAMDLIYSRATLTIVAASGSNANSGLPGLDSGSRDLGPYHFKNRFPESVYEFSVARSRPSDLLGSSTWSTRGWTYQERLCSHRLLIFTEQQVLYLCGVSSWCEDTVLETNDPRVNYEEQPLYGLNLPNDETLSFMREVEKAQSVTPFQEYVKMVNEYSKRDLTYPGDIIDAFAGGLARFQRNCEAKNIQLNFIFGLPTTWFELSLLWRHVDGSHAERRSQKWRHPSGVEIAFPSWSWMGWIGGVDIRAIEQVLRVEIDWHYIEPGTGALLRVASTPSTQPPPFWVQTSDAPRVLGEKWKPKGAHSAIEPADLDPYRSVDLAGKLACYTSSCFLPLAKHKYRREFHVGKESHVLDLDPEWAEQRVGESFEFIVFGRHMGNDWEDPGKRDTLYVMLIERRDLVAYRIGVGQVAESEWVDANPTWQLVVLG
ncbi:unnamed protein product [Clonostachys solani]|uniref:Heterokaryon incompatibility domain-containing protein n=1 Tax=Clonostachys solani TaxID=160281 RepID=A0A9N9Z145_9HYPO|nr:unnamed protein product [Clonostachys solani]